MSVKIHNKDSSIGKEIEALVIGSHGLVGQYLCKELSKNEISFLGTYSKRPKENSIKLDITKGEDLEIILKIKPKVVFHCANLAGGVDFCELNPEIAKKFHLEATKNLVEICKKLGAKLFFLSSDYVFDGTKGPYKEDDKKNPLNLYGKLKLEAENFIRNDLENYIIVRSTNIFGWDPQTVTPNYMMSLYRSLKDRKEFNAASFLWGNPTYVEDLAKALVELYKENAAGIFHVVGSSFVNRLEWSLKAAEIFNLDKSLIKNIKEPSPTMIPRPLKSWLSTEKFQKSFKTHLYSVEEGLRLMKSEIK